MVEVSRRLQFIRGNLIYGPRTLPYSSAAETLLAFFCITLGTCFRWGSMLMAFAFSTQRHNKIGTGRADHNFVGPPAARKNERPAIRDLGLKCGVPYIGSSTCKLSHIKYFFFWQTCLNVWTVQHRQGYGPRPFHIIERDHLAN